MHWNNRVTIGKFMKAIKIINCVIKLGMKIFIEKYYINYILYYFIKIKMELENFYSDFKEL
jgi:hypothetical protein